MSWFWWLIAKICPEISSTVHWEHHSCNSDQVHPATKRTLQISRRQRRERQRRRREHYSSSVESVKYWGRDRTWGSVVLQCFRFVSESPIRICFDSYNSSRICGFSDTRSSSRNWFPRRHKYGGVGSTLQATQIVHFWTTETVPEQIVQRPKQESNSALCPILDEVKFANWRKLVDLGARHRIL